MLELYVFFGIITALCISFLYIILNLSDNNPYVDLPLALRGGIIGLIVGIFWPATFCTIGFLYVSNRIKEKDDEGDLQV